MLTSVFLALFAVAVEYLLDELLAALILASQHHHKRSNQTKEAEDY